MSHDGRPLRSGGDRGRSVLDRFGVRLAYATDYATAAALVAEIIADADGELIAIDIETAPTPAEQKRLWAIRLQLADVVGRLKALTRLKTSRQRAALQAGRTGHSRSR